MITCRTTLLCTALVILCQVAHVQADNNTTLNCTPTQIMMNFGDQYHYVVFENISSDTQIIVSFHTQDECLNSTIVVTAPNGTERVWQSDENLHFEAPEYSYKANTHFFRLKNYTY